MQSVVYEWTDSTNAKRPRSSFLRFGGPFNPRKVLSLISFVSYTGLQQGHQNKPSARNMTHSGTEAMAKQQRSGRP